MSLAAFVNILAQSQQDRYTIAYYIAFQCLTTFFKVLAKRIGVSADRGKYGTFTMYFALELLCTLFYMLPFFGPSRSFMFYKGALLMSMNIYGMQLYRTVQ